MTPETARILAQALTQRDVAAEGLKKTARLTSAHVEWHASIEQTMQILAETYVHEDRIINRIVAQAED